MELKHSELKHTVLHHLLLTRTIPLLTHLIKHTAVLEITFHLHTYIRRQSSQLGCAERAALFELRVTPFELRVALFELRVAKTTNQHGAFQYVELCANT